MATNAILEMAMSEFIYALIGFTIGFVLAFSLMTKENNKYIEQCELNLPRNQHCELTAKVKE
jgi:ammonia channel protein AmtB